MPKILPECVYSILKPRPLGGATLIGYAIDTLRAEAPLHAASTPAAEAVLAAGSRSRDSGGIATILVNPMRPWPVPPLSRDPRTRDSDCGKGLC
jgi:hypothetical protein